MALNFDLLYLCSRCMSDFRHYGIIFGNETIQVLFCNQIANVSFFYYRSIQVLKSYGLCAQHFNINSYRELTLDKILSSNTAIKATFILTGGYAIEQMGMRNRF